MKHMRRSLLVVVAIMAALVIWSGVAMAGIPPDPYPPSTPPTTDPDDHHRDRDRDRVTPGSLATAQAQQAQGALAFTGSDRTLLWVGLGLLTVGGVAFVSTRRRAELRRQAATRSLG
jgi:hypothetical protein